MKLKYILALADCIRYAAHAGYPFSVRHIADLADFCARSNSTFDRAKWLAYIRDGPR